MGYMGGHGRYSLSPEEDKHLENEVDSWFPKDQAEKKLVEGVFDKQYWSRCFKVASDALEKALHLEYMRSKSTSGIPDAGGNPNTYVGKVVNFFSDLFHKSKKMPEAPPGTYSAGTAQNPRYIDIGTGEERYWE